MDDVFISYSRKDNDFVRQLYDRLSIDERGAWVDWDNIPLTADWLDEIKAGIEGADSFIYVISPDSVHSEVCAIELGHALEYKKRLVPIMRRELIEPHDQAALHPAISSHNWLFFREDDDFDHAYKALRDALDSDLEHMKTHTRLLVRSKEWRERGRDASLLLRGTDLREAEDWLANAGTKKPEPTELHTEFIMSSHNVTSTRQRRQLLIAVVFAALAVLAAVFSLVLYQDANFQRTLADIARQDAEAAQQDADRRAEVAQSLALSSIAGQISDRTLALAIARSSIFITDPPTQAERALADVAYAPGVRNILTVHNNGVLQIVHSPNHAYYASVSEDHTAIIWDANYQPLHILGQNENSDETIGHTATVYDAVFSADNEFLYTAGADGRIIVWDVASGDLLTTYDDHSSAVYDVALSPDGIMLASSDDDGYILLRNLETDDMRVLSHSSDNTAYVNDGIGVMSLAFHPQEPQLASGYADGRLVIWSLSEDTQRRIYLNAVIHDDQINHIEYTQDGEKFVTASSDEVAKIWQTRTGLLSVELATHTNEVLHATFSPDNKHLITTSNDRTIVYWEVATGREIGRYWAHNNWVTSAMFTADGRQVITTSQDETLIIWDLVPGNVVYQNTAHEDWIRVVDVSSDGTLALSGADDGTIKLWEVATGEELALYEGHQSDVRAVYFTPDNNQFLSGDLDGVLRLWTIETGDFIEFSFEGMEGVNDVAISSDGEYALIASEDDTVRYIRLEDQTLVKTLQGETQDALAITFSLDGNYALFGSTDSNVIYWDLQTDEVVRLEGHTREALSVAISPDGTRAVSGSRDAGVIYWNLETGEDISLLQGHGSSVRGIAYAPNRNYALSASADLSLFLWDLDTGEILREMQGHNRTVYDVDFTPDGRFAFSGSRDESVILWRIDNTEELLAWLDENRYVRPLTSFECEVYDVDCALYGDSNAQVDTDDTPEDGANNDTVNLNTP
jgi:WD40 repeat protein